MRPGFVLSLGRVPYDRAWDLQKRLHRLRVAQRIPDTLILLEHDPVITLGRRGDPRHIQVAPEFLKKLGISVFRVERGGDVTYHGPGQLVGYLIFQLNDSLSRVRHLILSIEEALIRVLATYGVQAHTDPDYIGVFVGNDKIAALGVAVHQRVSFHGFALNVNTNLEHFRLILPCGIQDRGVTSLERLLGRPVDLQEVESRVIRAFEEVFQLSLEPRRLEDLPGLEPGKEEAK